MAQDFACPIPVNGTTPASSAPVITVAWKYWSR